MAFEFSSILYILIGIGTLNWCIWLFRRTRSIFHTDSVTPYTATTSVVIPVYKEKKRVLFDTIHSILAHRPNELLLALDATETEMMQAITDKYHRDPRVKAFFVHKPGKRPSLAAGIRKTKYEIVVLVDSDTCWASPHFLSHLLSPFTDPKVGGVGTRQRVNYKATWAHRLIDWMLDLKYTDYIPSDALSGSVLCLSGRTAAYRRTAILPVLDHLEHDYFLGHKCMGGDDARLTSLVLAQGYKTVYQDDCVAESEFSPSILTYLRQKVRWSRNSFRTYLKALFSSWPWKQRRWYYIIAAYHTLVPGLSLLVGLFFVASAFYLQVYSLIYIFIIWLFISRTIRSYSHLQKHPEDWLLLPVVILYYYALSFIKLYALFTMTKESWMGSRDGYTIKGDVRVSKHHSGTETVSTNLNNFLLFKKFKGGKP